MNSDEKTSPNTGITFKINDKNCQKWMKIIKEILWQKITNQI